MENLETPLLQAILFYKKQEEPATPRTRTSVQTPCSILIFSSGTKAAARMGLHLSSSAPDSVSGVGPASPLPHHSFIPLPRPGSTVRSLGPVCPRAWESKAAHAPSGDSKHSQPSHLCIAIRVKEWEWSRTRAESYRPTDGKAPVLHEPAADPGEQSKAKAMCGNQYLLGHANAPVPSTGQGEGNTKMGDSLYGLHLNISPKKSHSQIPSQSRLEPNTLVSLYGIPALPAAAMIWKWEEGFLAPFRGTDSLPRARWGITHWLVYPHPVVWSHAPATLQSARQYFPTPLGCPFPPGYSNTLPLDSCVGVIPEERTVFLFSSRYMLYDDIAG